MKHRDDRFEVSSRAQDEQGLGFSKSILGNTRNQKAASTMRHQAISSLSAQLPAQIKDARFSLPNGVKDDYDQQLIKMTDLTFDARRSIAKQQKTQQRVAPRKVRSSFRAEKNEGSLAQEITRKLTERHNVKIKEAVANRMQDDMDHVPLCDPRIASQFDPAKQGKVDAYSDLMNSFQPSDLRFKHKPMPNKKRFGVMPGDAAAENYLTFTAERETSRTKCVPHDYAAAAAMSRTAVSAMTATVSDVTKNGSSSTRLLEQEERDPQQQQTYGNTKNFTNLNNNYSYQVQLQRQINKVRKHQPNASLSKLIDLSDLRADSKLSKDMIIKNIAANFKQHRANLRQGVVGTTDQLSGGSRTPHKSRSNTQQLLLPAGETNLRNFNNSVSPNPRAEVGRLDAQKEFSGQTSEQEWRMNVQGKAADWNLATLNSSINSCASNNNKADQMSQSSHQSLASYLKLQQNSIERSQKRKNHFNSSASQGNSLIITPQTKPPVVCDLTSTNPMTNPFKMSERNKQRNKASSIILKAPRGADRSADQHYKGTHKTMELRARSSTEKHLLPDVQPHILSVEKDFNAVRNKKVSVCAINFDSRPLKYSDFRLKDPEPLNLSVQGKKLGLRKVSKQNSEMLRDSIQSIHHERIAAQIAQTQMHAKHQNPNLMPQFQTLQVFHEKRPACYTSPEDRSRQSTIYHKTISVTKDLNSMKIKAAGINRDTQLKTPHQLRQGLLETNFNISFKKELDTYSTNNGKMFPRYKIGPALLEDAFAKDGNKTHDNKTNWGLRQVSQLSRHETPMKTPDRNEADKKLLQQFAERQTKNVHARRESISSRITMGSHANELQRPSPAPLMVSQSPKEDHMRTAVVHASHRDIQVKTRFAPQRNESSRMSMSLHSEKSKWYPREAMSPMSMTKQQQPGNLAFALSRRESSLQANFLTARKQDNLETRSVTSQRSSFRNF